MSRRRFKRKIEAEEKKVSPEPIVSPVGETPKIQRKICKNCYFYKHTVPEYGMCYVGYPVKRHINDTCEKFNPEAKRDTWYFHGAQS